MLSIHYFFSSKLKKGNWFALIIFLLIINIFFVGFFNGVFFRDNDPYDLIRDFNQYYICSSHFSYLQTYILQLKKKEMI